MEYTIIAGINGAGKSTLFNAGYLKIPENSIRINSDELIHKEYNNRWQDVNVQIAAGKQMVKLIQECIINKKSFNQETTLSGKNIIRTILTAKEQGFTISLYYVGLANTDLAIQRVYERMKKGGHGVDDEIIKKRYIKSLENLKEILPLCDSVDIYDNSNRIDGILYVKDKKIIYMRDTIPGYIDGIVKQYMQYIEE